MRSSCSEGRVDGAVSGEAAAGSPGAVAWVTDRPEDMPGAALVRVLWSVERLQREHLELAGRVGFLRGQLQGTQAQLLALAAPAAAPVAPAPLAVAAPPASGHPSPGRWRRLWRVLGGAAGA